MCGTIVYWCDTNIMPVSLSSYSSNPKDNFLCHDCIFFNVYKKAIVPLRLRNNRSRRDKNKVRKENGTRASPIFYTPVLNKITLRLS